MAAMLEVRNINCSYDAVPVIHGVSFEVQEGEIAAVIGSNGAGKSTVMKTIAGLIHPTGGQVIFRGKDISALSASRTVRLGLSYVPEGRRLFPKLTVMENLKLGAFAVKDENIINERLEEACELFPILKARAAQTAETLSGGEQQMCAIARGLMSGPKLLMIDELSLGLMPSLVEKVFEAVVKINKRGVTVLLVEQMVQDALEIADRGYVLQTGRMVLSGDARELLASDEVKKAYMGM